MFSGSGMCTYNLISLKKLSDRDYFLFYGWMRSVKEQDVGCITWLIKAISQGQDTETEEGRDTPRTGALTLSRSC